MLYSTLLFIAFFVFAINAAAAFKPGYRLIQFNETFQQWMPEQQVEKLAQSRMPFMDITDHQTVPAAKSLFENPIPSEPRYGLQVLRLLPLLEEGNLRSTITSLSAYHNRYYTSPTGESSSKWLLSQFEELSAGRTDIDVRPFNHQFSNQISVIARIRGESDETRIILGGHLDSIAGPGSAVTARAPGADDDGTGSATVLEVFRVLAQSGFKPKYDVEFHAYAAEEAGLRGSQDIAEEYFNLDIDVDAMLQIDMTAYDGTSSIPIGLVSDYTNPELTAFIGKLMDTYTDLKHVATRCGYGCSDHASWTKYGYRSAFPFETPFGQHNPYIHTANDLVTRLNMTKALEAAKFALGFVVEIGEPAN